MYLIDFFKSLSRKSTIPTIIYLIGNLVIITFITYALLGTSVAASIGIGLGLYIASLAIALSPVGEWILRLQTGCKETCDPAIRDRMDPLFEQAYAAAKKIAPQLPDDIKLFYVNDESQNAFAIGRKTIAVNTGFLRLPDEMILATLGHEFGHLAHKDTDRTLLIVVGNLIISGVLTALSVITCVMNFIINFFDAIFGEGFVGLLSSITTWISHILVGGFMWVWTKIGYLLIMKTSRDCEYEADAFSADLGYGEGLISFFSSFSGGKTHGVFAVLSQSHPDNDSRIARLRAHAETKEIGYVATENTVELKNETAVEAC